MNEKKLVEEMLYIAWLRIRIIMFISQLNKSDNYRLFVVNPISFN